MFYYASYHFKKYEPSYKPDNIFQVLLITV